MSEVSHRSRLGLTLLSHAIREWRYLKTPPLERMDGRRSGDSLSLLSCPPASRFTESLAFCLRDELLVTTNHPELFTPKDSLPAFSCIFRP